jgi:ribosomal protein L7/L12
MPTAIRLTPSTIHEGFVPAFDLTFEGLNQKEARSLAQLGHDLILGTPAAPLAQESENCPNPLAQLDVEAQKTAAVMAKIHNDRFGNKIMTIKMIRILFPGTDLKEAKDFVEFAMTCTTITGSNDVVADPFGTKLYWVKF